MQRQLLLHSNKKINVPHKIRIYKTIHNQLNSISHTHFDKLIKYEIYNRT